MGGGGGWLGCHQGQCEASFLSFFFWVGGGGDTCVCSGKVRVMRQMWRKKLYMMVQDKLSDCWRCSIGSLYLGFVNGTRCPHSDHIRFFNAGQNVVTVKTEPLECHQSPRPRSISPFKSFLKAITVLPFSVYRSSSKSYYNES
ncbi:hypothetical protein ACJIZ3_011890 [Penstemon smallii]|uniref:Uncharacterized protein n=1 Tax=Penstemon smallii TaxID=265156 RepID=A0ABD3UPT0_9LAMI